MIDKGYIKELAEILKENSLTEISLKDGNQEIIIKKEKELLASAPAAIQMAGQMQTEQTNESAPTSTAKGKPITSPMVGTFYKATSPDSEPFVKIGTQVKEGQVVCIIEAMKLMNEIESDAAGKVIEICVEDGQPVEFGQVLMYVE